MARLSWLTVPASFNAIPVTILTVILYGAVFVSILLADRVADVPRNTKGLDLDQAYVDLQQITARPHPYISHANDDVHAYILSRLEPLAQHPHVHLVDDLTSNASYFTADHGTYYEGTNILFKVDGTDSQLGFSDAKANGVLLSAHYDSVSTSPGATDDGMGVVTLLALAEYLSAPERRPRKTAVFFWNNGEEDGLNGAVSLWKHPWSNLTSTFINLEGAASGGRPLVFRSTSIGPARAFLSDAIAHPHIDVLVADAWQSGVIRSGTDYQVYSRGLEGEVEGMSGVDYAFYQQRAYYHTPLDSIVGMGYLEGRKSLWAMMDGTRGAALSLLNDDETGNEGAAGVYFDVLGRKVVVFSLRALFVTNVVMLVVGPIVALLLLGWVLIKSGTFSRSRDHSSPELSGWAKAKKIMTGALCWGKFWIALIIGVAAHIALVAGYVHLNPYVVHSRPYLVLTTFLALAYLALVVPLQITQTLLPASPRAQKLAIVLEHYFLTWLALVFSTVATQRWHLGGLYWVTAWNISAWTVAVVTLVEGAARAVQEGAEARKIVLDLTGEEEESEGEQRMVRGVRYETPENGGERDGTPVNGVGQAEVVETEPTEITPLMQQHRNGYDGVNGRAGEAVGSGKDEEYGWWIAQLLLAVPLSALLLFRLELLVLLGLNNTVCDGSSPRIIYTALAFFSLLIFIPIAPFAHKLHRWLTLIVAVIFAMTLIASWVAFPFTRDEPFKVFFQQSVELGIPPVSHTDLANAHFGDTAKVLTELTGLPGYVDRLIIPELPSSKGKEVACTPTDLKPGLITCKWEGELFPSPGNYDANALGDNSSLLASAPAVAAVDWLHVKAVRVNATRAIISLTGTNTRACRLYFDKPITSYHVHDHGAGVEATGQLAGYEIPKEGATEIRLWSRTWDNEFVVEFGWEGTDDGTMDGRAACEWAEYASALAGGGGGGGTSSARIPALEEVKQFLPLWALPTKMTDGLVEAWSSFSV
ncbi:hypothetical protein B0H21DRAFT_147569 [Amylocystis lapponica]|nr:hypothetical protein B0H21DRAFT_147569 [Amylocystis lapponica]